VNEMQIRKVCSVLLLMGLALPLAVYADGGILRLSASDTNVEVGEEVTVDVIVEGAPTIYGADVRLTFDPELLEAVDADEETDGIQLEPGGFIDAEKSFVLQHGADNEAGIVDYALALLNPAPAVEGDGTLVRITFLAKAEGQTTITIEDGLFGTQTGETIAPALDSIDITIVPEGSGPGPIAELVDQIVGGGEDEASNSSEADTPKIPIVALIIVLVAIGVIGIGLLGYWLGRRNR
jgi:hypothetical protein